MGMHFGMVVADVAPARLLAVLDEITPKFVDGGPIASLDEAAGPVNAGWELAIGDHDGRAYLLDTSYLLSGDADLIVRIARTTRGLVIGCGAETVSGSFYLAVARGEKLLRHYNQCLSDLSEPYSSGTPVPGEEGADLDDIDGNGLLAVLSAHGFDFDAWAESGTYRKLVWSGEDFDRAGRLPWAGAASAALEEHRKKHKLAPRDVPPIGVKVRVVDAPPKKPWWKLW